MATEADVAIFEKKDGPGKSFDSLLSLVEEKVGIPGGPLSTLKSRSWPLFCSFTHTGYQALLRRINEGKTGIVNYVEPEIISALSLAGTLALLSAIELAILTQDEEAVTMAMAKAKEYAGTNSNP
jgi:hypothetical protein